MSEVRNKMTMLKELEERKETIKEHISADLEKLRSFLPKEAGNKFQYEGEWYLIKSRGGKSFVVNFGEKEPGSWKKKT